MGTNVLIFVCLLTQGLDDNLLSNCLFTNMSLYQELEKVQFYRSTYCCLNPIYDVIFMLSNCISNLRYTTSLIPVNFLGAAEVSSSSSSLYYAPVLSTYLLSR